MTLIADIASAPIAPARRAQGADGFALTRFAAVTIPLAGAGLPLAVYLPAFYAAQFGLSLTVVGLVFMAGRIWDAVTDPWIGALSDATRSRFGRRRPWILVGGAVFAASSVALFFPPTHVDALYLGLVLFVFYIGWTMIQIPFSAWAGELSRVYHERTRIATYVKAVSSAALLAVLILPTVFDTIAPGDRRLGIGAMGAFILVTTPLALWLTLTAVREPPAPKTVARPTFKALVAVVASEPLLLRVLASDFAVTLAQTVRSALFVFFVADYLGARALASGLFLFQFVFGALSSPLWLWIGRKLGKSRAGILGELLQVAINLALFAVAPGQIWLVFVLAFAQGMTQGSGNLMLQAIVADVADQHRLRTGEDRLGLMVSVFSVASKAAGAVGVGVALPLVAVLGFQAGAGGANSAEALWGLKLVFALGPALAHLVSALLLLGFPLDEARHRAVVAELEARDAAP